jgi:hypothetical protein
MQTVILLSDVEGCDTGAESVCWCQDERQVDVLCLGCPEIVTDAQELAVAHHIVDGAEAQLGHDGTELVGDVVEEVDNVLGRTGKLLPKLRVLSGNANRASVKMAPKKG